ncbi:hypothetical protein FOA52_004362 [Chlamydomonas sp. UWO 241]|nr:hypothetical protein FOA52_004362 [Chlamydomonas sp. UWO 241]
MGSGGDGGGAAGARTCGGAAAAGVDGVGPTPARASTLDTELASAFLSFNVPSVDEGVNGRGVDCGGHAHHARALAHLPIPFHAHRHEASPIAAVAAHALHHHVYASLQHQHQEHQQEAGGVSDDAGCWWSPSPSAGVSDQAHHGPGAWQLPQGNCHLGHAASPAPGYHQSQVSQQQRAHAQQLSPWGRGARGGQASPPLGCGDDDDDDDADVGAAAEAAARVVLQTSPGGALQLSMSAPQSQQHTHAQQHQHQRRHALRAALTASTALPAGCLPDDDGGSGDARHSMGGNACGSGGGDIWGAGRQQQRHQHALASVACGLGLDGSQGAGCNGSGIGDGGGQGAGGACAFPGMPEPLEGSPTEGTSERCDFGDFASSYLLSYSCTDRVGSAVDDLGGLVGGGAGRQLGGVDDDGLRSTANRKI